MLDDLGVPTFVHSDHCAKKLLPWFDGMLEFDKAFFEEHGEPLFTSHMLDLSEEPHAENIGICAEYFKKMAPMKSWLNLGQAQIPAGVLCVTAHASHARHAGPQMGPKWAP